MKINASLRAFLLPSVCAVGLGATAACTHVSSVNVQPTAAVARAATPLSMGAAVVLEPGLTSYRWSYSYMGETFEYPMGEKLREYAEEISRKTLKEISVFAEEAAATGKADVIMIPRVIKIDQASSIRGFPAKRDRKFTMVIEWTVKDRANAQVIRLATIMAQSAGPGGTVATYKERERVLLQELFDDLSLKTAKTFGEWWGAAK